MTTISIIITIINVICMCVMMHTLGKQKAYDNLLKHYKEAIERTTKQDALIKSHILIWRNIEEKPNVGSEILVRCTGEDGDAIFEEQIFSDVDWESYAKDNQVKKWCYVSDLCY